MNAEIRSIAVRTAHDEVWIDGFIPSDTNNFCVFLLLTIGPAGGVGSDSFWLEVCSPSWLADQLTHTPFLFGRHLLIISEFDSAKVRSVLADKIAELSGQHWVDLALKISRFAHWEFEDYRPLP